MTAIPRGELVELLNIFNEQYQWQEKHDPKEGYVVQFAINDRHVKASLYPRGETRKSHPLLPGISRIKNLCLFYNDCPFCPPTLSQNPLNMKNITQKTTTDVVQSLSGQVLIIPKKHYSQWFDAPIDLQADLLQEAIAIRNQHPQSHSRPIELHCGAAGGQTVFHIHVRTNVYLK